MDNAMDKKLFVKNFLKMAENAVLKMKFRVRSTEEKLDGYSYFDPIIEHEWQDKYKILFEKPWLYSAFDEPLLPDETIVTLEIECWEPRWVRNIQAVD